MEPTNAETPVRVEETTPGITSFRIDASVLHTALKEVMTGLQRSDNLVYFAVTDDPESTIWTQNRISDEIGEGRLVIGVMGSKYNYTFVEVPVKDVVQSGTFLIKQAEKIFKFANTARGDLRIEHHHDDEMTELKIYKLSNGSRHTMPMTLCYTDDQIEDWFSAVLDRFDTPEFEVDKERIAEFLQRASKIGAKSGNARSGDLIWKEDSIEFVTVTDGSYFNIATSQKLNIDTPFEFDCEMPQEHLTGLLSAFKSDEVRINLDTETVVDDGRGEEELREPVLQIRYKRAIARNTQDVIHVERQIMVNRENPPIKTWGVENEEGDTDDQMLFAMDQCKLFATVPTEQFIDELKQIWIANENVSVRIERAEVGEDEAHRLQLLSGDPNDLDYSYVQARFGDSEIESYKIPAEALSVIETLVDEAQMFQILSSPHTYQAEEDGEPIYDEEGEPVLETVEIPNAFIIAPLPNGADVNSKNLNVGSYLILQW